MNTPLRYYFVDLRLKIISRPVEEWKSPPLWGMYDFSDRRQKVFFAYARRMFDHESRRHEKARSLFTQLRTDHDAFFFPQRMVAAFAVSFIVCFLQTNACLVKRMVRTCEKHIKNIITFYVENQKHKR